MIYEYQKQDTLYILSHEQSLEIGKRSPEFIGRDPTLLVYDRLATDESKKNRFRGFRLNLGILRNPEQAISRLQDFVRFVAEHRHVIDLQREVQREMHKEGFEGFVKILREGFEASIEMV